MDGMQVNVFDDLAVERHGLSEGSHELLIDSKVTIATMEAPGEQ